MINFKNLMLVFIILMVLNTLLKSVGVPDFALFLIAFMFSWYSNELGLPIYKNREDDESNT